MFFRTTTYARAAREGVARFCAHQLSIGVLNVYAPNVASSRAKFWCQITDALLDVEEWCVGSDFCMVEHRAGHCGANLSSV